MRLKHGVVLALQHEMAAVLQDIDEVFEDFTHRGAIITSATEGVHREGSLHYEGRAIDLRTRDLEPAEVKILVVRLKRVLGATFDVVLERDHIHVEYDP